ncbi:MAG: hypothetical protein BWY91_03320 [bacterium ADurb.BinA028]|nr:MAG: hypothetical protein BWY91_03320 [bacterium ADurb.BinA028]
MPGSKVSVWATPGRWASSRKTTTSAGWPLRVTVEVVTPGIPARTSIAAARNAGSA